MPQQERTSQNSLFVQKLAPFGAGVIFLVVSIAGYFLVIQPEISKFLTGGPLDVEVKKQIVENRKAYLSDMRALDALYEQYGKGDTSKISTILPSSKDLPSLFSSYERLAKNMGIGLQSIDIVTQDGKVKNVPGVKEVLISLKFANIDYVKFKKLLAVLEANARFTDVVSFDIQPDSQFATLNIKTYYSAEK